MTSLLETSIAFPTALLLVASVLDVMTGRFPNTVFIASVVLGAVWLWSQTGVEGVMKGFGIGVLVFIALTPLVFTKALGAGDIKLLTAFSLLTSWQITLVVFLYSLVWGLIIGLSRVFFAGEGKNFFLSLALRNPQVKSQKIPYTVAILMGWFSYLLWGGLV
jgi:Flp pilus assembly protein protease CpaA